MRLVSGFCLGLMYENGTNVPKDEKQAKHWFEQAADRGDKEAKHKLATLGTKGTDATK
jgi:TPR repeat protein